MDSDKILINGKEYNLNEFTDEQNYLVRQVSDLSQQSVEQRFKLDQIVVAKEVFTTKLTRLLEEPQ